MREKSLLCIAVVTSIVGLVVLACVRPDVSPQFLQMEGEVRAVRTRGGVSFIEFAPSNFTVVSFSEQQVEEGNQTLIGRLQPYKGKVEFVVESTIKSRVER